ncbi:MAG: hypothetical protein V1888_02915 [archaeon]
MVFGVSLVSALPIYVAPLDGSGNLQPNVSFNYTFNFTTGSDCSGVLVSESEVVTTDSRGMGFVDLDISGLTSKPSYLCEYRDGSLRKMHNFSDGVFEKIWAEYFIGDGGGLSNLNILGNESGFEGWDKNASDDMTYTNGTGISLVGNIFSLIGSFFSGSWNDLTDVPAEFADGVDNDSQKNAGGKYVYNDSTTIYSNDSYLEETFVGASGGDDLTGAYTFNGGWEAGGISIVDGDIYAQKGWFYDISSLEITHLKVNGSLFPDVDNQFDVGNGTFRWRDLHLSGEVLSDGAGDNYLMGNVGVGTETPSAKLEVVGTFNASSNGGTLQVDSDGNVKIGL